MFYITTLLLVVFGVGGITREWLQKRRQVTISRVLEQSDMSRAGHVEDNSPAVERMMKKNSWLVSLSEMLDKNIVAKALTVAGTAILLILLNASGIWSLSRDVLLLSILLVTVIVILLPQKVKEVTIKTRMKRISVDLPFIIDMMAVCVQSGMTIEKSLRHIADNTGAINPDISALFDRAMLKTEVNGINAALEQLYEEVPGAEVRMLCSTLQQSIKYGSSIYQVLIDLSKEMRALQLLEVEEKVASLSAKMTIPMIGFIMFPLLVIVAGPGLIGMVAIWSN